MVVDSKASAAPPRGAGGGSRSGLLDVVRLFSGFDIVAYHTGAALGDSSAFRLGIGMAIFLLMSAVSVGMHPGERPFRSFLAERSQRYLTPFAFWWVVYAVMKTAMALHHEQAVFGWFEPSMLWQGTQYHLWFMPVALGVCVAVEGLRRATRRVSTGALVTVILLLSPLLFHAGPALRPIVANGWFQWVWTIPAIPIGVAFGRIIALPRTPRWGFAMLAFSGVLAASGITVWSYDHDSYPLRFAIGALLIGIGFSVSLPSNALLYRARTVSAGIFLSHPLILRGTLRFFDQLPVALAAAILWALSGCLTLALQRTRLARFVGDPPAIASVVPQRIRSHELLRTSRSHSAGGGEEKRRTTPWAVH